MTGRRRRVLAVVAVLGTVLVPAGVVLVAIGVSDDRSPLTVAGILAGLAGLVSLRVLSWSRRIRVMTQAGLAFHVQDQHDQHDPQNDQDDQDGPGA